MHLLPTLNRIRKLTECLESFRETEVSTPGLILVDREDMAKNIEGYDSISRILPSGWRIEVTQSRGFGDKVREVWPDIRSCDWVSLMNDEHFAITKEWDKKLLRQITGKNFVSCNDRWNAPARAAGCTMWSMPLLECVGWPIFPPQINHLGIDDVWERLGRATGTWRVDMSVVVEHRHVFRGGELDETHKLTYGEGPWNNSPAHQDVAARMQLFMENEWAGAVEKVKKFSDVYSYFVKLNPQGAEMHKAGAK
jgi:hypothetical protein